MARQLDDCLADGLVPLVRWQIECSITDTPFDMVVKERGVKESNGLGGLCERFFDPLFIVVEPRNPKP